MESLRLAFLIALAAALLAGCPSADDDDTASDDDDATLDDDDTVDDDDATSDDDDATSDDDDSTPIDYGEPPTASVEILPGAPGGDDLLVASVTADDPEGMDVSVTIRWSNDGVPVAALNDLVFVPAALTSGGEEWMVTVVANDGGLDSTPASDSVIIGNASPTLSGVTIVPPAPTAADDVSAIAGITSDPEGDAVTLSYDWWINGSSSGVTGDTLTSSDFSKGDVIQVLATPNDGNSDGASVASNVAVAVNTAPSGTGATVDPTSGTETTTFTCSGDGFSDADGDTESWLYTWTVNGVLDVDGATLDGTFFNRGDYIVCEAWPLDGETSGSSWVAAPILVDNTAPSVADVTISPNPASSSDMLTATPGHTTDVDGDSVTFSYAWTVNAASAGSDSAFLEASEFGRDDEVAVTATPTDGSDAGAPMTSATLTIDNTPPSFTGVDLSYHPPSDSWIATGLGWADADGDAEGYTYLWENSAGTLAETGGTLLASSLTSPDTVAVTLTADDGTDVGNSVTSATMDLAPALTAAPGRMDWGAIDQGCDVAGRLRLQNTGTSVLEITTLTLLETVGTGYFSIPAPPSLPLLLPAGGAAAIDIEYAALDESEATADLEITTNDANNAFIVVPLTASSAPADEVSEYFYGDWDPRPFELAYVPLFPIIEIDHDFELTDEFTYDPVDNTIEPVDSQSTGEITIVTYTPTPSVCLSNLAPVVLAEVVPGPTNCEATEIDASASYDPDADSFEFTLEVDVVPAGSVVDGDWVSTTTTGGSLFTDLAGDYEVEVTAEDILGAVSLPVSVQFTADANFGGGIAPPLADAGPDIVTTATADCWPQAYGALLCDVCDAGGIQLDGSASSDPDGRALSYEWTVVAGDLAVTSGQYSAAPILAVDPLSAPLGTESKTYTGQVQLVVTDCDGNSTSDVLQVSIACSADYDGVGVPIQDD